MNREQLLQCPKREWDKHIEHAIGVYVIPTRKKHDSGYAIMEFVAETDSGEKIRFGGCCDDVSFEGEHFRMDCDFESKLIHIWNRYKFTITDDVSSISFVEEGKNE